MTGETIVLTLGTNSQDIERLEAAGDIKMTQVDRITTGEQLTYISATEDYIVIGKGKLVRTFKRAEDGRCQRGEGSVLTFSRAADTLQLEGKADTRSQTATQPAADASCPPLQKR